MRQYYISFSRYVGRVETIYQRFVKANNVFEAFVACDIDCRDGVTRDKVLLVYSEDL